MIFDMTDEKHRIDYMSRAGVPMDVHFFSATFPWDCANGIRIADYAIALSSHSHFHNALISRKEMRESMQKRMKLNLEYLNCLDDVRGVCVSGAESLDVLKQIKKNLEHLWIELVEMPFYQNVVEVDDYTEGYISANESIKQKLYYVKYDTAPIYSFGDLKSLAIMEELSTNTKRSFKADVSRFRKLEKYSGEYRLVENLNRANTIKSLELYRYSEQDLKYLSELILMDSLKLGKGSMQSIDGCEKLPKLQCLYLFDNEKVEDIGHLRGVKNTLKALRIHNCNRVKDFSVLEELENLELLELSGKNSIPSLSFVKKLKNLKTLIFNVDVLDNDLTPCFDLEYVECNKRKLSYNHKFKPLPKGEYVNGVPTGEYIKGNEDIEMWRRFE